MRALITFLFVMSLTACGSAIESADEEQVSIRFHSYIDSPDSLLPMADEHCGSYDRIAIFQDTSMGDGVTGLPLHAEFACRTR